MSKNKNRTPSSSRDSKMEKTKHIIRKTGEIVGETALVIKAIGEALGEYKKIKKSKQ